VRVLLLVPERIESRLKWLRVKSGISSRIREVFDEPSNHHSPREQSEFKDLGKQLKPWDHSPGEWS